MIDLYTWSTPNGRKVSIALEEMGLDYRAIPVDIGAGEQHAPEFLRVSPNNKIPAIVDGGTSIFESGAILVYLARKSGAFLAVEGEPGYWRALEWLMWQMGGYGPMLGQAHHFLHFNPGKSDYAEERYAKEAKRLYGVLEKRLSGRDFVADDYSIADMAIFPWIARWQWHGIDWADYPQSKAWLHRVADRPAVQRGFAVPKADTIPLP